MVEAKAYTVRHLSSASTAAPLWKLAVFAHNEGRRIGAALGSIQAAATGHPVHVVVLANGCTDDTVRRVHDAADALPHLTLVEIALGDKANAWNIFVHDLWSDDEVGRTEVFFLMDGDVRLEPEALPRLASLYGERPSIDAVGGMPTAGRDKASWRQRMVRNRSLAGNLYSLRGQFVADVRARRLRMPVGLFGEDRFVSWLVESRLGDGRGSDRSPRIRFHEGAGFTFDSLSPWRPRDHRTYLRRLWRYARRGVQHEMLMPMIGKYGVSALPGHIEDVYRDGPIPSRMKWIGRGTFLRFLAMQWVRRFRAQQQG